MRKPKDIGPIAANPDSDLVKNWTKDALSLFVNEAIIPSDIEQIADLPKGETFQVDIYKGEENSSSTPRAETYTNFNRSAARGPDFCIRRRV
jgi:hypothetical protein